LIGQGFLLLYDYYPVLLTLKNWIFLM
jgi:hypothetical protein